MKNEQKTDITETSTVIKKKFIVEDDYIDPLRIPDPFEEIEIEEVNYYYGLHLGVPIHSYKEEE